MRTAVLGLLAALLTGLGVTAGAGVASACAGGPVARSAAFASTLPQVRYGQSGTTVQGLQLNLKDRGYSLTGTGYYGPLTLAAVKDFQRKHGINPSGIVGSRTWQALVGSKAVGLTTPRPAPRFSVYPGERDRVKVGTLLGYLGRTYGYGDSDTWYGPAMQQQVKRFQKANGIKASGIVGAKTWAALNKVISIAGNWGC
ncbi:peptidoglycan-binding protein [Actinophytocola sp.]|uniref:peptidoglycan-binding domain-containing protein n=1 Tax=Actinophytocola sp. TaxID=1872138 RepID=UPI002D7EE688|nr:peptidoglycan-binding protein [Actinophytocola sp.]HET9141534.1 peptidoglycan-binding protein [Actinophytocola sp.]